ncbi:MAG: hypothetical protein K2K34_01370 [Oscillospiraceae bacterium]|nr:hypothetical protein [Oscillospiraceae bacterium]
MILPVNIKKELINFSEIYTMLGCSKQNISYWSAHSYSTQYQKSIRGVIENAALLFELSLEDSEILANSAGLTLYPSCGNLYEFLDMHYKGKLKELSENALISERMLRYYKKISPTKQALLAIAISLNCRLSEIDALLRSYGYCLSKSSAADIAVIWFMENNTSKNGSMLLVEINTVLDNMGFPLLMTRQIC